MGRKGWAEKDWAENKSGPKSDLPISYSELDSFGSSTVPGHLCINIFVFQERQSIPIYYLSSHFPKSISCLKFVVGCQILIYRRRDHETRDCAASMESENTSKQFTSHFLNIHLKP